MVKEMSFKDISVLSSKGYIYQLSGMVRARVVEGIIRNNSVKLY